VPVERVAAIILIPGSILWAAAQIRAFGYVLSTVTTGVSVELAIGVAAVFTMLYTMFGGLLADAVNDVIQGTVVVAGLTVIMIGVLMTMPEQSEGLLSGVGPVHLLPPGESLSWALLEEWAIPICGSVVATELVGRIIATKTPNVARRSAWMAGVMYIAVGLIPLMIGLFGQRIVPALGDAEQVIPAVAQVLLPTFFFAIFAGGLVAAILSTVDSTLLVSSGLMSHNLIVPMFRVTDERRKVLIARAGVFVFGAIAYIQAVRAEGVFELVEEASAFGSAGTLISVCFGLFTRFGGAPAALLTLLMGVTSYVAATLAGAAYPYLLSLAASLLTYVLVAVLERTAERVRHG
jgi:Na+/proline symporter